MNTKRCKIAKLTILIMVLLLLLVSKTYAAEVLIFSENFESKDALKNWKVYGNSVEIVTKQDGSGSCVKISKDNRRDWTNISKEFRHVKGTLRFEAQIQCKDIVRGDKNWDRGKFQAVVKIDGKDVDWPADDFHEDSGFIKRQFRVFDLTGKETVVLRIGLQNAKGTVWVDDIKVFHEP